VPVSRSETIATVADMQKEIQVEIFQGESRKVADNVFLGKINFPIPEKKAGEIAIDVRFTYDVSGVLEAEALVHETQERHKILITENAGVMSTAEIEKRFSELAELKIHPRDQMENRTLIAKADRLYEQTLGEARKFLAFHTTQFQAVLETQDPAKVRSARSQFAELLHEIEKDSFL
jgi:molecular chaperone HscC